MIRKMNLIRVDESSVRLSVRSVFIFVRRRILGSLWKASPGNRARLLERRAAGSRSARTADALRGRTRETACRLRRGAEGMAR